MYTLRRTGGDNSKKILFLRYFLKMKRNDSSNEHFTLSEGGSSSKISIISKFDENKSEKYKKLKALEILSNNRLEKRYNRLVKVIETEKNNYVANQNAKLIQRHWRSACTKRRFYGFLRPFMLIKQKSYSAYFYALLLQIQSRFQKKEGYFEIIKNRIKNLRCYNENLVYFTYEQFRITGLFYVHKPIKPETVVKFALKMYRETMRRVILTWRVNAAKSRNYKKKSLNFQVNYAALKKCKFGLIAVCFDMWRSWASYKGKFMERRESPYPEWNGYLNCKDKINLLIDKGNSYYCRMLKYRAYRSIRNYFVGKMTASRQQDMAYTLRKKQRTRHGFRTWYSSIEKKKETRCHIHNILMKWFRVVQTKKHRQLLYSELKSRHEYFQKRFIVSLLLKNKSIETVFRILSYTKIQKKPSLALFYIHTFRGDDYSASLAKCMYLWAKFCKRRKAWQSFVFGNIQRSSYNITKMKAFNHLAKRTNSLISTSTTFTSPSFQRSTKLLYREIKDEKFVEDPFLLVEGDVAEKINQMEDPDKTQKQQRDLFMEAWQMIDQDLSLFTRVAIINMNNKRRLFQIDKETLSAKMMRKFAESCVLISQLKLASPEMFELMMKSLKTNYENAKINRSRITIRDAIIVKAYKSHDSAIGYNEVEPTFTISDVKILNEINTISEIIVGDWREILPVESFSGTSSDAVDKDSIVQGIRLLHPSDFHTRIGQIHKIIKNDLYRTETAPVDNKSRNILSGRYDTTMSSVETYKRIDNFRENMFQHVRARTRTGIDPLLREKFPNPNRPERLRAEVLSSMHICKNKEDDDDESNDERVKIFLESRSRKSGYFASAPSFSSTLKDMGITVLSSVSEDAEEMLSPRFKLGVFDDSKNHENMPTRGLDSIQESSVEEKGSVIPMNEGIIGVFDSTLFRSLDDSDSLKDPDMNSRYLKFLEILFGEGHSDKVLNDSKLAEMRERIILEYKARKTGGHGGGLDKKLTTRSITPIIEAFRGYIDGGGEETIDYKDYDQQTPADSNSEFLAIYNSRKYRKIPGRKKEDGIDEEDDCSDVFREGLTDDAYLLGNGTDSNAPDRRRGMSKYGGSDDQNSTEVHDGESSLQNERSEERLLSGEFVIDSKEDLYEEEENNMNNCAPGSYIDDVDRKQLSLRAVNKVVRDILRLQVEGKSGENSLDFVDVDNEVSILEVPLLSEVKQKAVTDENISNSMHIKPRRKPVVRVLPRKSDRPIVIKVQREVMTPLMAKALSEEFGFTRLILDNGTTKIIRNRQQAQPIIRRMQTLNPAPQRSSTSEIQMENRVVSFSGASRQVGRNNTGFKSIRVSSSKSRLLASRSAYTLEDTDLSVSQHSSQFTGSHATSGSMNRETTTPTDLKSERDYYEGTRNMIKVLVQHFATSEDNRSLYQEFICNVKLLQVKPSAFKDASSYSRAIKELYKRIKLIYTRFMEINDTSNCMYNILMHTTYFEELIPLLKNVITDQMNQDQRNFDPHRVGKLVQVKQPNSMKPNSTRVSLEDAMNYKLNKESGYRAVAIHYNVKALPEKLDVLMKATTDKDPVRKTVSIRGRPSTTTTSGPRSFLGKCKVRTIS